MFAGWRAELASCREVRSGGPQLCGGPADAETGLYVNEASYLDLADAKWDLGLFGKLHVRKGKGACWWA